MSSDEVAKEILRDHPTYMPWIQTVIEKKYLTEEEILIALKDGLNREIKHEYSLWYGSEFSNRDEHLEKESLLKWHLATLERDGLDVYLNCLSKKQ